MKVKHISWLGLACLFLCHCATPPANEAMASENTAPTKADPSSAASSEPNNTDSTTTSVALEEANTTPPAATPASAPPSGWRDPDDLVDQLLD